MSDVLNLFAEHILVEIEEKLAKAELEVLRLKTAREETKTQQNLFKLEVAFGEFLHESLVDLEAQKVVAHTGVFGCFCRTKSPRFTEERRARLFALLKATGLKLESRCSEE